jgi:hypothetical protein
MNIHITGLSDSRCDCCACKKEVAHVLVQEHKTMLCESCLGSLIFFHDGTLEGLRELEKEYEKSRRLLLAQEKALASGDYYLRQEDLPGSE